MRHYNTSSTLIQKWDDPNFRTGPICRQVDRHLVIPDTVIADTDEKIPSAYTGYRLQWTGAMNSARDFSITGTYQRKRHGAHQKTGSGLVQL